MPSKKKPAAGEKKPEKAAPSPKPVARKAEGKPAAKTAAPARGEGAKIPLSALPPLNVRRDLDRELIEAIRGELLRKKLELGSNLSSELDEMREATEGHHLADMDDLGGDAHDEETAFKIMEIESAALDQIDYALERMGNGTYGVCESCDKAIASERLKALPFATLCIECKRQQEVGEE